jgi:uncharacterized protein YkwD
MRLLSIFAPLLALPLLGAALPEATLAERVLAAINDARAHPHALAEQLRTYRGYFQGKVVRYPGNDVGLMTTEGTAAVDEAIGFLEQQAPLEPLTWSDLLAAAAGDHVAEQGPTGATGHVSKDGANPGIRVTRRGGGMFVAETITYGPPSAGEVVRQLVVDDNVPSRGHRHILFAREFRFAGVACGPHAKYRAMCVVDFSGTAEGR